MLLYPAAVGLLVSRVIHPDDCSPQECRAILSRV